MNSLTENKLFWCAGLLFLAALVVAFKLNQGPGGAQYNGDSSNVEDQPGRGLDTPETGSHTRNVSAAGGEDRVGVSDAGQGRWPWYDEFIARVGSLKKPKTGAISEDFLTSLEVTNFNLMSHDELTAFLRVVSIIANSNNLTAEARFEFINTHVPQNHLNTTADDLIRNLKYEDLDQFLPLIDSLPRSSARASLYGLVTSKMVDLGLNADSVNSWIDGLESEDDRENARAILDHKLPKQ